MRELSYEHVESKDDLYIHEEFKTRTNCSFLNQYETTGVENRETELFGSIEFRVDSFRVYGIEFEI